jgi:hypothetical protein
VFVVDGSKVKLAINGRDDTFHLTYSGGGKGTLTGRKVSLTTRHSDGSEHWLKLDLSDDGSTLTGGSGDLGYSDKWNDHICTRP